MNNFFLTVLFSLTSSAIHANPIWKNCDAEMYQESVSIERDIANAITHGDRPKIDIFANRSLKLDIGLCAKQFTKEDFCQQKSRLAEEYDLLIRASAANNLNLITHRKNLLTIKADLKTLCPAP